MVGAGKLASMSDLAQPALGIAAMFQLRAQIGSGSRIETTQPLQVSSPAE